MSERWNEVKPASVIGLSWLFISVSAPAIKLKDVLMSLAQTHNGLGCILMASLARLLAPTSWPRAACIVISQTIARLHYAIGTVRNQRNS
jgi:hypothetical protein